MFGRKKADDRPEGEPTPARGRVRPEESVLDELSRAFGVETDDDNAALIADDDDETADATQPLDLNIVTSDGPEVPDAVTPTPPARRNTIQIGEGFDGTTFTEPFEPVQQDPLVEVAPSIDPVADSSRPTIAIGGSDDLPDAVYLDSAFGDDVIGNDDSGTVFIDDDGTGDALAIKDATTPGIEPRLRQRRIGVRRAASRRRIKWVLLGVVGALLVLGILTVLGSGWFAINNIDVSGAVYTDKERLQVVIDDLDGTPVLLADTEAAERELEAIPWVEDARVRTHFPNAATIEIRERTPVATMSGVDGRFRVLDAEGRILDVLDGQPVAFVLLGGPSTLDLAPGQFAPVGPASAASLVTKLTPTIRPRVLSIEVTDDGSDLVMYLAPGLAADGAEQTTPIRVRFGSAIGDSDQIEKLVRLEDRLDDPDAGALTEINVTTNEVTGQ